MNNSKKLKVLTFSFNTNDIKLCSKEQEQKCTTAFKSRYKCSYCKTSDCYIPQFFKLFVDYAIDNNFDIVYIATQNDHLTDKHNLHRDYLINYFKRFGKILKQRIKTGMLSKDIDMKSSHYHSFLKSGLSSSIFVSHKYLKKSASNITRKLNKDTRLRVIKRDFIQCNSVMNKTKGGLYTTMRIHSQEKNDSTAKYHYLTFVNINLKKTGLDREDRDNCINKILQEAKPEGDHTNTLICCGCFNYDMSEGNRHSQLDQLSHSLSNQSIRWSSNKIYETTNTSKYDIPFPPTCMLKKTRSNKYDKCDVPSDIKKKYDKDNKKLISQKQQFNGNNKNYETFNNKGVATKLLTKMTNKETNLTKDRKEIQCKSASVKKCKYSHKVSSPHVELYDKDMKWCDRILYSSVPDQNKIKCTEYTSYDFGQFMANSKHRAVYSHIEIKLK